MSYLGIVAILFAFVHAGMTSSVICGYSSSDGTCSGEANCTNECESLVDCGKVSCDLKYTGYQERGMNEWGDCWNAGGTDMTATCEDDGVSVCNGYDVCFTSCKFSSNGLCEGHCFDYPLELEGESCDDIANSHLPHVNFTFGECFTMNETDNFLTCLRAIDTSSSNNSLKVFGTIAGVVAGVLALAVIVYYLRKKRREAWTQL